MNIILAGMPGCGKTSVSARLGRMLGWDVYDTDAEIVREYGEINAIFADRGEQFFRDAESLVVDRLSALDRAVIATGGGCLIREQNVAAFKKNGKIVYLETSVGELAARLKGDSTRPLLKGDAELNLKKLYSERAHIYAGAADITVKTDGFSPEEIAAIITENIKS